ncbi:MAG: hypothetical protein IPQ08_04030 [Chitinophagaceae bacterium]|nr:hypothetical protein [Chitinophagaceae bacterium]
MWKNLSACFIFILCSFSFSARAQDVTGIWKGYFITETGEYYKLEFQVARNSNFGVTGVSYSYLDIRFYGKATMTGTFIRSSNSFRIREIKTVEVKSQLGGTTCIMNYSLNWSRSGKEEFLDGTYLGKNEDKTGLLNSEWGSCGAGKVHLRRVTNSDFYVEPFLKNKIREKPVFINEGPRKTDSVVEKKPVITEKPKTKPVTSPLTKPVTKTVTKTTTKPPVTKPVVPVKKNPVVKTVISPSSDSLQKIIPPVTRPVTTVPTPEVILNRSNELIKVLTVRDPKVSVKIYDNGEIDGDTISVYLDKKLVLSQKRLTASPLLVNFTMEDDNDVHELTLVAENLGTIPPNTSLMIVESGEQRFEVRITSTEQKNAVVRFKFQK